MPQFLLARALQIQARASRRCGELLKQIEPKSGARTDLEPKNGGDHRSPEEESYYKHQSRMWSDEMTRKQAAQDAGLSERQQKTVLRLFYGLGKLCLGG